MKIIDQHKPINIVGIEIKTRNDNGAAFRDIPAHWRKFQEQSILDKIPNKVSGETYGVYTRFENEGRGSDGAYSFIIGARVETLDAIPEGFVSAVIPKSKYQVFESATGHPEKVGEKWREIWGRVFERKRTFVLDYELYRESGEIEIFIGVL